jgi:KRAB domain-containing zinc finger protein
MYHFRTVHRKIKPKYQCTDCDYSTNFNYRLKEHCRKHSGEKPFRCDQCDTTFLTKRNLTSHTKRMHEERKDSIKCKYCDSTFMRKDNLINHVKSVHPNGMGLKYQCNDCDFSTNNKSAFTRHHRTHTGEKSFKCNQCGTTFARKGTLVIHTRRVHKSV